MGISYSNLEAIEKRLAESTHNISYVSKFEIGKGILGLYKPKEDQIIINADQSQYQRVKTITHENVHRTNPIDDETEVRRKTAEKMFYLLKEEEEKNLDIEKMKKEYKERLLPKSF